MPLRNANPVTFKATGVTDSADGTNAPPGSMSELMNLIPAPGTTNVYVPRPAADLLTSFGTFSTPAGVTALLVVGTRVYGMISSAAFAGKDQPFCYDVANAVFIAITGPASGNLPTTQSTSGDWTPPTMAMIGNTKILVTHPGFSGANKVGLIDISSFSSATLTGSTHSNTVLDTLSANPITTGWQVGMTVSGAGIVAGTTIVSLTAAAIVLSQAASATAAGVAITVAGGTAAAPLWSAGTTNTNALAAVPTAVAVFNGRAWFAVSNTVVYSDSLNPMQVTNTTQSLTLGDNQNVTAFGGLPLSNVVAGGVVQSLIAFKGASSIFQITGDATTSDLANNQIAGAPGTLAPRSICSTPMGLAYMAPDGYRILTLEAKVTDPIGAHGTGVTVPFSTAVYPSRACAAYNSSIIKASVQNGNAENNPVQDWWYDMNINCWTGPHSFPASAVGAYSGGSGNTWIQAASGVNAKLFQQAPEPIETSSYTENGSALTWGWTTSLLPDNAQGAMNSIIESTQALAIPYGGIATVEFADEEGGSLGQLSINSTANTGGVWGTMTWGTGLWGGAVVAIKQYGIPWQSPIIFKQGTIRWSGASALGFAVGNFYMKYSPLGYMVAPT